MRQTTAEAALVEEYRPLVRRIALSLKRRVQHRAEIDDLMQAGMEGLLAAAPRYTPESGASLETFVGHRIRGAMYDALRATDWAPRSVARGGRAIAEAIHAVELREQRPARESEIAAHMGLALHEYRERLLETSTHHVFSIEETPAAFEAHAPQSLHDTIEEEDTEEKVRAALASLPERERYVIEQTYLGDATLLEVGNALGVTESRVCQLRTQGVARLRARLVPVTAQKLRKPPPMKRAPMSAAQLRRQHRVRLMATDAQRALASLRETINGY